MKTIHFVFSGLFLFNVLLAQDIIFTNTGQVYEGKIIEIGDNYIKYKRKELPDGPTYTIDKSIVTKIKYSNNKEEIFDIPNYQDDENLSKKQFDSIIRKKKNIIGYDVAQFVYVSIGMSYERFFGKQSQFSIRIPFSVGFNYIGNQNNIIIYVDQNKYANDVNYYIYQNGKIAGGTLEFNYYPFKMSRMNFYVGPYFEYGTFTYKIYRYSNEYGNTSPQIETRYNGVHVAGGIQNGFLLHLNSVFTLQGTFGLGLKKDEMYISGERILTQARFNFIFGIKF